MIVPPALFGHELAGDIVAVGDRVTRFQSANRAGAVQRRGPVGKSDGVTGADLSGQRLLELGHVRALRKPVALEDLHDGGDVVVVDRLPAVRDHEIMWASSSLDSHRSLLSLE